MTRAVFFDLDGTFADTAPDLSHALNCMRETRGLPPLPLSATRHVTSLGARGLLSSGFGMSPEHPDYRTMRAEFLAIYERNICRETRLFPGTTELLEGIEGRGLRWGIVTNKAEHLARLLLGKLEMESRASCIIGGDSTAHLKPHPEPLLAACRGLGIEPAACIYVGDDRRDVEAGHSAGMKVAVVRWGYLNGGDPERWNADWMIDDPQDLLRLI
jgi:2-phosphoglycolate phosphatase